MLLAVWLIKLLLSLGFFVVGYLEGLAGAFTATLILIMILLVLCPIHYVWAKNLAGLVDMYGVMIKPKWQVKAALSAVMEALEIALNILLLIIIYGLIEELKKHEH